MKLLQFITTSKFKEEICDVLKLSENVSNFHFVTIDEHSKFSSNKHLMSKKDLVVGYIEKVKLEIILTDDMCSSVISSLTEIKGLKENSYYWFQDIYGMNRLP